MTVIPGQESPRVGASIGPGVASSERVQSAQNLPCSCACLVSPACYGALLCMEGPPCLSTLPSPPGGQKLSFLLLWYVA